jgi:hypothetical protein
MPEFLLTMTDQLLSRVMTLLFGALAYDNPTTRKVYHLMINQAIHKPHLDHHLFCPMQCQVNDVIVDNMPKVLMSDPTDQTHALTIRDPDQPAQMVILPLALQGVTLLLNVRGKHLMNGTVALLCGCI